MPGWKIVGYMTSSKSFAKYTLYHFDFWRNKMASLQCSITLLANQMPHLEQLIELLTRLVSKATLPVLSTRWVWEIVWFLMAYCDPVWLVMHLFQFRMPPHIAVYHYHALFHIAFCDGNENNRAKTEFPYSKVHMAYMGPTWVLSAPRWAPCWPHEPCY